MLKRLPTLFTVGFLLLLAAGCSASDSSPVPNGMPTADRIVVMRTSYGGLCPYGECLSVFTVRANGTWTIVEDGERTTGDVSAEDMDALAAGVRKTKILDSESFSWNCPSDYDGTVLTYDWFADAAEEDGSGVAYSVSSCDHAISGRDPLVKAVDAIATEAYQQQGHNEP